MKLKTSFSISIIFLLHIQSIIGQEDQPFLYTKGDGDVSIITIAGTNCTVVEYPEFLVLHEIPSQPGQTSYTEFEKADPFIAFIDSVYQNKPIKYVLNSHSHTHSLAIIKPFLDNGTQLVTAQENIPIYEEREMFGDTTSLKYMESIIAVSSDTVLLSNTQNPIEIFHLKKSEYENMPTETFMFFNYTKQNLLNVSCMLTLEDCHEKYGFAGKTYTKRFSDTQKIIEDRKIQAHATTQLYGLRTENDKQKLPAFSLSHLQNVLKHGREQSEFSDYLKNLTNGEITMKRDSLIEYFIEDRVYPSMISRTIHNLIKEKRYERAVIIAQMNALYRPHSPEVFNTLGEAYFNNGQTAIANYYDKVVERLAPDNDKFGIEIWEKKQKERLEKDQESQDSSN